MTAAADATGHLLGLETGGLWVMLFVQACAIGAVTLVQLAQALVQKVLEQEEKDQNKNVKITLEGNLTCVDIEQAPEKTGSGKSLTNCQRRRR